VPPGPWLRSDFRSGPGGGYAASTPAADDEHVFCVLGSAVIAALTRDGVIAWRKEIKPYTFDVTIGTSPVLYENTVLMLYAMARSEDSRLVAFDKKDGSTAWQKPLTRPTRLKMSQVARLSKALRHRGFGLRTCHLAHLLARSQASKKREKWPNWAHTTRGERVSPCLFPKAS